MAKKKTQNIASMMPTAADEEKWKVDAAAHTLKELAQMTPAIKSKAKSKLREDRKSIDKALKMQ